MEDIHYYNPFFRVHVYGCDVHVVVCVLSCSKLRAKLGLKPLDVGGSKVVPEVSLKAEGEASEPGEITGEGGLLCA